MTQIDETTQVPLKSVFAVIGFILTVVAIGVWRTAFWVSHVDEKMENFDGRIARIEQAMHIQAPDEQEALNQNPFMNEAQAQVFRMKHKESGYGIQKGN